MEHKSRIMKFIVSGMILTIMAMAGMSCRVDVAMVAGVYTGIMQDTENHRIDALLQLDPDMHYRYRTMDLSVEPVAFKLEEGTWYLEQGVVGLTRNGMKDIRFMVEDKLLVSETAHAAFPELTHESLSLRRTGN